MGNVIPGGYGPLPRAMIAEGLLRMVPTWTLPTYMVIVAHQNSLSGTARLTVETIAHMTRRDERTVRRDIGLLIRAGAISANRKGGQGIASTYRVLSDPTKLVNQTRACNEPSVALETVVEGPSACPPNEEGGQETARTRTQSIDYPDTLRVPPINEQINNAPPTPRSTVSGEELEEEKIEIQNPVQHEEQNTRTNDHEAALKLLYEFRAPDGAEIGPATCKRLASQYPSPLIRFMLEKAVRSKWAAGVFVQSANDAAWAESCVDEMARKAGQQERGQDWIAVTRRNAGLLKKDADRNHRRIQWGRKVFDGMTADDRNAVVTECLKQNPRLAPHLAKPEPWGLLTAAALAAALGNHGHSFDETAPGGDDAAAGPK